MEEYKQNFRILVTGSASSGVSSYINSFVGGFVAHCSQRNGTINPILYTLTKRGSDENMIKISDKLEEIYEKNKEIKTLKDCDFTKIQILADNDNSLLSRQSFDNNIILLDCPILDETEDKIKLYDQIINNNIEQVDMIIYVTNGIFAFEEKTELKQFTELTKKIKKEKLNGHYIELIIIVNKIDDLEDTSNIIFNIAKKTGISIENIFRYSSHKKLINVITEHKQNLYVPNCMKFELKTILKNANVRITDDMYDMLGQQETSGMLFGKDIKYIMDGNNNGDWDNSTENIKCIIQFFHDNVTKLLKQCFSTCKTKIHNFLKSGSDNKLELVELFNTFHKWHTKCEDNSIDDNIIYDEIVINLIQPITRVDLVLKHDMLVMTYQYVCEYSKFNKDLISQITKTIISNGDYISDETHKQIIYYALKYESIESIDLLFSKEHFTNVFSSNVVYADIKEWCYDMKSKNCDIPDSIKESFIEFVICNKNTPMHAKVLLQLLMMNFPEFKSTHNIFGSDSKYITALKFMSDDFPDIITYILNSAHVELSFPLKNNFFKLSNHVEDFIKKCRMMRLHLSLTNK